MTATTTGAMNVTPTLQLKAKRRSVLAGVKALENRLNIKLTELGNKRQELRKVEAQYAALEAEANGLRDAYDLVKPQPRNRKKAGA